MGTRFMASHKKTIQDHFSKIAGYYRRVRTTDLQPIGFISERLKGLKTIKAADIGCGAGRYDLLLFKHLNNLHLTLIDISESMLKQASGFLRSHSIGRFFTVRAHAHDLPLKECDRDCVFSFNAIHHFDFHGFIEKVARITKRGGFAFIYTRLQSQNERTIWTRHFPLFLEKEKRLYELHEITGAVESTGCSALETIKNFQFKRRATLDQLLDRANKIHYSTFALCTDTELRDCLQAFEEKITRDFADPQSPTSPLHNRSLSERM